MRDGGVTSADRAVHGLAEAIHLPIEPAHRAGVVEAFDVQQLSVYPR